jgi:hypothetical protein
MVIYEGMLEKGIVQKVKIDSNKLPAGIYVARLQTPTGISEKKIVITH